MRFEIAILSTPDERYDGTVKAAVAPVFAHADVAPLYEEGGASAEQADNLYGFEATGAQAAAILFGIALATGMPVAIRDLDADRDAPEPAGLRAFVVLPGGAGS